MSDFKPSEPIGRSDEPDSPMVDEEPADDTGTATASCTYQGSSYSPGAVICINKTQFKCASNGNWVKTGFSC